MVFSRSGGLPDIHPVPAHTTAKERIPWTLLNNSIETSAHHDDNITEVFIFQQKQRLMTIEVLRRTEL